MPNEQKIVMTRPLVLILSEVRADDVALIGGKCASRVIAFLKGVFYISDDIDKKAANEINHSPLSSLI